MCRIFTDTTGIATICLRPPGIWSEETFDLIRKRWAKDPMNDRRPFWEYGAFIALSDVAEAVKCAVHHPSIEGHATLLISADEAALAEQTSYQAAREIHPTVPWRGGPEFDHQPFRTLVDNQQAKVEIYSEDSYEGSVEVDTQWVAVEASASVDADDGGASLVVPLNSPLPRKAKL